MSRHRFRAHDYIEHMLEATLKIQTYVSGKTREHFLTDPFLQDAVVRNLEILGEASYQLLSVLPDAAERFPKIPFRTMYATRNRMIHGYLFVNYETIWQVADHEIPALRAALETTLAAWPDDLK